MHGFLNIAALIRGLLILGAKLMEVVQFHHFSPPASASHIPLSILTRLDLEFHLFEICIPLVNRQYEAKQLFALLIHNVQMRLN